MDAAREYCLSFPNSDVLSIGDDELKLTDAAWCFEDFFPRPHPLSREIWVGLLRDSTGTWFWLDESSTAKDRWEIGYPTSYGGDCTVIATSSWNDDDTIQIHSYACKKSP